MKEPASSEPQVQVTRPARWSVLPPSDRPRRWPFTGLTAAVMIVIGCTQAISPPDLGGIYNMPAQHHDALRNPVILIPGITGTRLVADPTGQIVWGAFAGGYANPETPAGARLAAHPMALNRPLSELQDEVRAEAVLDRARVDLLGLPVELNAYIHILATLGAGGYRDQPLGEAGVIDYGDAHYTCFQFPYDWRRDNVENARRLHEFILEKSAYVQAERERRFGIANSPVKFDIVAHSMGGLVARYYLRYGARDLPEDGTGPEPDWAGAAHVERLIMVGTPNGGSVKALQQLVDGVRYAAVLPKYEPALLGTMPSIYQLLPRGSAHVVRLGGAGGRPVENLLDPRLWEEFEWGLADPGQDEVLAALLPDIKSAAERREVALDHQRKCLRRAQQFFAALDLPASPPAGLSQYLFAGDAVPTSSVVAIDESNGDVTVVARAPGDGTVTRDSALGDLRLGREWHPGLASPIAWTNATFLFTDHLGLTRDPAFADNVLFLLLEARSPAADFGGSVRAGSFDSWSND
jgi:pimeloyl-ACP methyl ester carboxylesterase